MRRQQVINRYFCDNCNEEVSDRRHILIESATRLGWVAPPKWQVDKHSRRRIRTYQFCSQGCFAAFLIAGI
jgi:hypothetical protein